ncbi:C39 family peptidase [Niameybacter massiliensis]|uniref:C39 family peptidase n=1 Tax=Niameybacter massiliensis TaxID=1658108 RepID=UPI0006B4343B|nr:C39 family peptidase [Niameybacter massiliensis]
MKANKRIYIAYILLVTILISPRLFASQKVMIQGVPIINQHPELPTGCELTALTMLLQYNGVKVSKQQVAKEVVKVPIPYTSNGKLYGGDPNKGFIGDPFSKNGFGVYKDAILPIIEKYLPGRAEDLSGGDFSQIYKALDEGKPVMLWTTIAMLNVDEKKNYWTTLEGKTIEWKTPEHAMVAIGYDDEYIYLNDPYVGKQRQYKKEIVINRWSDMGKQAIAIKPSKALPKVEVLKKQNALIENITYINFITVDEQGTWIQARMLPNVFPSTGVSYDEKTYSVVIDVKAKNIDPQLFKSIQVDKSINQAIPKIEQINYHSQLKLQPTDKDLVTYNMEGKRVDMVYKMIDGITYINKEWVENFYSMPIKVID